jgi:rare lipoprotein A
MKSLYKHSAYNLILFFSINYSSAQTLHESEGFASYYADDFHGKPTSSGEIYDMNKLTAAHPYLPFNTWVKVTNVANNKMVTVRINDRGPFARNRIIDLSLAAAKILGMLGPGTIYVRLEIINPPIDFIEDKSSLTVPELDKNEVNIRFRSRPAEKTLGGTITDYGLYNLKMEKVNAAGFVIQLASFTELRNAKLFLEQIDDVSSDELFIQYSDNRKYRIVIGVFKNREDAEKKKNQIQNNHPGCFVITLR